MNIILTRPAAASSELLLAQFVWTFSAVAALTPPAGWTLVDHITGTGLQQSIYKQSGPLTTTDETWTISTNQAWSAAIINCSSASVGGVSHASGNSTTLIVTAPVVGPAVTNLALAFYGIRNFNLLSGVQTPGSLTQNAQLSSFWEWKPAFISAINLSVTSGQAAAWVETMLILTGTPSISIDTTANPTVVTASRLYAACGA